MSNCRNDVPEFNDIGCNIELSDIRAFALVDETVVITDPTDPDDWDAGAYEANILIFSESSGSYTASVTEVSSKGRQDMRTAGIKHEATIRLDGLKLNNEFADVLNKADNYRLYAVLGVDHNTLLHSIANVSINMVAMIPEGTDQIADWQLMVKWSYPSNPVFTAVPTGIFV